jgi:hypothetical protein
VTAASAPIDVRIDVAGALIMLAAAVVRCFGFAGTADPNR